MIIIATYTPKSLRDQTALTTGAVTVYTATATTGIIRTITVSTPSAGKNFTLSQGTDAAGTRLFEAYPLTQNVAAVLNGWWVITSAGIVQALCAATAVSLGLAGYEYV